MGELNAFDIFYISIVVVFTYLLKNHVFCTFPFLCIAGAKLGVRTVFDIFISFCFSFLEFSEYGASCIGIFSQGFFIISRPLFDPIGCQNQWPLKQFIMIFLTLYSFSSNFSWHIQWWNCHLPQDDILLVF